VQLPATCSCTANQHCNDNNPCTRDTCNVGSGRCFYTPSPVGTVCRQAALGGCDATEVCDGASSECPVDRVAASGTLCRGKSDACDVEDVCDGQSATCPADRLAPMGTVCGVATQACEANSTCNGIDARCPSSAPLAAGTVCRAAANALCDRDELCDGRSLVCGTNVVVDGVQCDDGNGCTSGDTCTGGQCTGQITCECENAADCAPRNSACATHRCVTGQCVADVVTLPASCNDNDSCTINDACVDDGRCVGELGCPLVPPFVQSGVLSGADGGDVQLVACSGRGECCRGRCTCAAGFVGDACERQATAPPTPRPTMSTGNGGDDGDVGVGVGDIGNNSTNVNDECPRNPHRTMAGACGCDAGDSDNDGIDDCVDGDYTIGNSNWPLQLNLYNPDMLMQLVGRVQLPSKSLDNSTGPHRVQAAVASDVRKFMLSRVPLRYGWALNLSVWHADASGAPTGSAIDPTNAAQVCLAPAAGYSSDPNLCLAQYVARLAEWRCVDERLSATADGLVCGTTTDLGMGNRQNWQLLTVMAKAQTGDFFAKLEEAFTSLLGDIGLPLWIAVVIGIGGFCCAIWLFCSSAWLTKRAYVEHKERRAWDAKVDSRRERRHEIEALGDGGRRDGANADGGVVDKVMAPVFATLTPALVERERRDRERNAKAAKVLADVDANDGDVGLKPLRMGTTKFEGQKARDAKAKRATGGPRLEKHVSEWGWGAGVEALNTSNGSASGSQQTMSSPRGRSRGEGLHANERANAPIAGTETLRFHTIRAPDGSVVTMTRRGAQDSRPSRAAEREKRTMRRLEREHNRRAKSATRAGSSFTSEKQIRDAFEDDVAEAQSPLAQRGMETIVAAELAAWRSGLPTEMRGTTSAKARPIEKLKEKDKMGSARSERGVSASPKLERKATAAAASSSTPKVERKTTAPPPITIMPTPSSPPMGDATAQQLMTMHIAGQREAVAERLKTATPAVRKEFKQLLQARRSESTRNVGGVEQSVKLVAANALDTKDRTCTRCQAWLSGNVVAVGEHEFRHVPCFRCDECQDPLAKQFFKHGTRNLCKKCHDEE
jgi:hypothetical protein